MPTKGRAAENARDRKPGQRRREFLKGAAKYGAAAVAGGAIVKGAEFLGHGVGVKSKGFSRARPIVTDSVLPKSVDVAIIGGGFIGTATALALAERGVSVALFEKGVIAGESSGRSGGLIEAMFADPAKLEITELSKQRWRDLQRLTGEDVGFVQRGSSMLFAEKDGMEFAEQWLSMVKGMPNGGARMLSAAEIAQRAAGAREKFIGGLTTEQDGSAEPALAAPAMALGARKLGAKIHQFCAVRGIDRAGGRVAGVVTERGYVKCSSVLLAGGVWSQTMARDLGLDLRTLQCFAKAASLLPFDGPDFGTVSLLGNHEVGWRKQSDGGYIVWEFKGMAPLLPVALQHPIEVYPAFAANAAALSPRFNPSTFWRWVPSLKPVPLDRPGIFEETRIYEPELPVDEIDEGIRHLQETVPMFERGAVRERWSGAMQMAMDNMPIISPITDVPGLFVGTGFYYGLTMGPGAGVVLADMIMGNKPPINVHNFRYSRFTDGSPFQYYM